MFYISIIFLSWRRYGKGGLVSVAAMGGDCQLIRLSKEFYFSLVERFPSMVDKLSRRVVGSLPKLLRQVDFGLKWIELQPR